MRKIVKIINLFLFCLIISIPKIVYASGMAELNPCSDQGVVNALGIVGICLNVVKIVVPLLLIFMGMIDMIKPVISQDTDSLKKNLGVFVKRAIASIVVFIAPSLLMGLFNLVDGFDNISSEYSVCVSCVLNYGGSDSSCPGISRIGE